MSNNPILEFTFQFALDTISYCEQLEEKRKYVISRQLLKSGTSIGANVKEAQAPESKADFIHKMKVAAKEAEETSYWLSLCQATSGYPNCQHLLKQLIVIQKILSKIISSAKRKTSSAF